MKRFLIALLLFGALLTPLIPSSATADQEPQSAHLIFVGDVMMGRYVNARMQTLGFDWPFNDVRGYLSSADITVGNLEGPLVDTTKRPLPTPDTEEYDLSGDMRSAPALARAGFNLLSVANNHTFDAGVAGLQSTVSALTNTGIAPLGTDQISGQQPVIRVTHGLKIAFLAYDAVIPNLGAARQSNMPFVTYLNPASSVQRARFSREIASAKQNADIVIVIMHWGIEYVTQPIAAQKQLAILAANAGADLVVGAHPHEVQGLDMRGPASRPTLIAYSLGNALFDQSLQAETRQGFALDVVVDAKGVSSARLVPTEVRKRNGGHTMQLADDPSGQPTLKRAAPSTDPRLLKNANGQLSIGYTR